ncbi:MAG: hypothetical protein ACK4FK_16055 [Ferrovibrio sp.]|jgi:hypothetical protein|uniref:hypothetical protein n=1 Tax=Ferrovibrio sp. TaxID=1917215 RepID=UPI00391A86E1
MLLLPLLLAACATAQTEWVRSDTPPAQRDRDEKECTEIASRQAFDESMSSKPLYPPWTGTGFNRGAPPWSPFYRGHESPSYFDRGPRQYELADYCMRQRGYTLQNITPARK